MTRSLFSAHAAHGALALLALLSLGACSMRAVRTDTDLPPLTIEHVLAWSLEGPQGRARAVRALNQRRTSHDGIDDRLTLDDGVSLRWRGLEPTMESFGLMVDTAPCLSTSRVAAITGAGPGQPRMSAHLEDMGLSFNSQRNGVRVEFVSQSKTIGCVNAIYILKEWRPAP